MASSSWETPTEAGGYVGVGMTAGGSITIAGVDALSGGGVNAVGVSSCEAAGGEISALETTGTSMGPWERAELHAPNDSARESALILKKDHFAGIISSQTSFWSCTLLRTADQARLDQTSSLAVTRRITSSVNSCVFAWPRMSGVAVPWYTASKVAS